MLLLVGDKPYVMNAKALEGVLDFISEKSPGRVYALEKAGYVQLCDMPYDPETVAEYEADGWRVRYNQ